MSVIRKDLGVVTAYAYAVSQGYQGTEEEFAEELANGANYAREAETAKTGAETAQAAAEAAQGAAEDAQEAAEAAASGIQEAVDNALQEAKESGEFDGPPGPKGDAGDPAPASAVVPAVEDWLEENVAQETGYVLDRSLQANNAAAPADLVGDLKNDFNNEIQPNAITYTDGAYINLNTGTANIGSPTSSAAFRYAVIPCQEGDVFTINGKGNSAGRIWAFAKAPAEGSTTVTLLTPKAGSSDVANNLVKVAPAGSAYLILNDNQKTANSYYGKLIYQKLTDVETRITGTDTYLKQMTQNFAPTWEIGGISTSGDETNNKRIRTVEYLYVHAGDRVIIKEASTVRLQPVFYSFSVSIGSTITSGEYICPQDGIMRFIAANYSQTTIEDITAVSKYINFERYLPATQFDNELKINEIPETDWEYGSIDTRGFLQVDYALRTRSMYHIAPGDCWRFEPPTGVDLRWAFAKYDADGTLLEIGDYQTKKAINTGTDSYVRLFMRVQGSTAKINKAYASSLKLYTKDQRNNIRFNPGQIAKRAIYAFEQVGMPGEWEGSYTVGGYSLACDCCFVGNELWIFNASEDDDPTSLVGYYRFVYNDQTDGWSYVGGGKHNLGHVNSIEYNRFNDCLICGNGSGSYTLGNKVFIIPNASELENDENIDTRENVIVIDCAEDELGAKLNVVWGDENFGRYDICYMITNDNAIIRRVQLGMGSVEFDHGTIIENTPDGQFNGTYKILSTYRQDDCGYETCVNGAVYNKGILYCGIGHTTGSSRVWAMKLCTDGTIRRTEYNEVLTDANGTAFGSIGGLTIHDGYLYIEEHARLQKYKM